MNQREDEGLSRREQYFENNLDLLKSIPEIKSSISKNITSDFTLAKLDKEKKEVIIEMVVNAYHCHSLIEEIRNNSIEYSWDKKNKCWKATYLNMNKEKSDVIKNIGDKLFNTFMTRNYMIVILARNTRGNYLIDTLTGNNREEEINLPTEDENKGFFDGAMNYLKPDNEKVKREK